MKDIYKNNFPINAPVFYVPPKPRYERNRVLGTVVSHGEKYIGVDIGSRILTVSPKNVFHQHDWLTFGIAIRDNDNGRYPTFIDLSGNKVGIDGGGKIVLGRASEEDYKKFPYMVTVF